MKLLQFTLVLSAVYSSSEGILAKHFKSKLFYSLTATGRADSRLPKSSKMLITTETSKPLERSQRSFKIGAITIQNDLDEFVRVSVQDGIQNRDG